METKEGGNAWLDMENLLLGAKHRLAIGLV